MRTHRTLVQMVNWSTLATLVVMLVAGGGGFRCRMGLKMPPAASKCSACHGDAVPQNRVSLATSCCEFVGHEEGRYISAREQQLPSPDVAAYLPIAEFQPLRGAASRRVSAVAHDLGPPGLERSPVLRL